MDGPTYGPTQPASATPGAELPLNADVRPDGEVVSVIARMSPERSVERTACVAMYLPHAVPIEQ
jgi:hypothetical protein